MSNDKDEIRKMLSAPLAIDRLPCATIGCTRPSAVGLMCAEHYDFHMKLGAAYAQALEYRRIAELALNVGLEECERLRNDLAEHHNSNSAILEQVRCGHKYWSVARDWDCSLSMGHDGICLRGTHNL